MIFVGLSCGRLAAVLSRLVYRLADVLDCLVVVLEPFYAVLGIVLRPCWVVLWSSWGRHKPSRAVLGSLLQRLQLVDVFISSVCIVLTQDSSATGQPWHCDKLVTIERQNGDEAC